MISEPKRRVLELFREGRELYKQMKFAEAYRTFGQALKIDPSDGPSKAYLARCKHYAKNPPSPEWDGVWVYTTK
ncbi:MAG: hypothetical protein ACOC2Y_02440 [Spirochaetota bacterium]